MTTLGKNTALLSRPTGVLSVHLPVFSEYLFIYLLFVCGSWDTWLYHLALTFSSPPSSSSTCRFCQDILPKWHTSIFQKSISDTGQKVYPPSCMSSVPLYWLLLCTFTSSSGAMKEGRAGVLSPCVYLVIWCGWMSRQLFMLSVLAVRKKIQINQCHTTWGWRNSHQAVHHRQL